MRKKLSVLVLVTLSALCIISCTPTNNSAETNADSKNQTQEPITTISDESNSSTEESEKVEGDNTEILVNGKTLTILKPQQVERYDKGVTKVEHLNQEAVLILEDYEKQKKVSNYEDIILDYYNDESVNLLWTSEKDEFAVSIWINDKIYPYSYGRFGSFTEQPFVIIKDINNDGKNDILSYCFQYKTELRQDVYLSQPDGSYMELGDITWNPNSEEKTFEFSVEYKDNFMVHIQAPEYEIDVTEPIGEELQDVLKQLGVYEENGTLVEQGQKLISNQLQGKGITYAQDDNGKTYVIYDAPISLGYSDYHLPYGFQFVYMIGDNQYQLEKVSFIKD